MNKTKLLTTVVFPRAFDSGKAGWKMDGDKIAVDANGNPIYLKQDGTEQSVQGDTISKLNAESKGHRERAEKAENSLKVFEGVDPDAAKKAIETVSKLDAKQLIDAGEVDKVKDEISKQFTAQIAEKDNALSERDARINNMTLERAFDRSAFIAEKVAVPPEMFQATFGKHFKIEDGKVVPYGADGNKIFSKKHMGEIASVDEAFEIIVDTYPHKETILKPIGGGGTGSGGGGGNRATGRTVRRADFDAAPPTQKAELAAQAGKGEISIVD